MADVQRPGAEEWVPEQLAGGQAGRRASGELADALAAAASLLD